MIYNVCPLCGAVPEKSITHNLEIIYTCKNVACFEHNISYSSIDWEIRSRYVAKLLNRLTNSVLSYDLANVSNYNGGC